LAHQYILKRQNIEIIEKEHVNKVPTDFYFLFLLALVGFKSSIGFEYS
jgi:hypothetical protein